MLRCQQPGHAGFDPRMFHKADRATRLTAGSNTKKREPREKGSTDLPACICRRSCSWNCSCHRSIGTGNGPFHRAARRAGDTGQHTSLHRTTARPSASS